jgi:hypothetical protein
MRVLRSGHQRVVVSDMLIVLSGHEIAGIVKAEGHQAVPTSTGHCLSSRATAQAVRWGVSIDKALGASPNLTGTGEY